MEANTAAEPWDYASATVEELAGHVGSGLTPFGGAAVYEAQGVPFIRSQNVHFEGLDLSDVAHITLATHRSMMRSEVFANDVLLNITGASIGRCCVMPDGVTPANVNQHVCAIRLRGGSRCDARFLNAVLASHIGQSQIDRLNAGSNREGLNYQQIRAFRVPWPDAPLRDQISAVLDTLDEVIRDTEHVIVKLKQVEEGMLHDLLARGIDDNGDLRDPERHPEQFKDSVLGRIPKDWAVSNLRELALGGLANGVFKEPSRAGRGCALVNVSDLYTSFGIDLSNVEQFGATQAEIARFAVTAGDLFFTRSSLNLAGIAQCNIVRKLNIDAVYECHVMRLRPVVQRIVPEFLAHWCRSPFARSFLMGRAKQVTMTTISQPDLYPLPVPVPPSIAGMSRIL